MKKLYTITAVVVVTMQLLFYHSSFAQAQTDTTFFTQMNYIFANLDKSKVPYGILRDYAMEFTNIENYNGTAALADSNYADVRTFWNVYQTLLTGRVSTSASGFISPQVTDSLWYIQRDTGLIVLSGLYFNYSRFKDDAANNYVTVSNGQLYDKYAGGVWQNPYQDEQAFLLSPPVNSYSELELRIVLPANLWFTNNGAAVTGLQIDADDGLGYRTLTAGVPLSVSYTGTGHKEWKYKLTLNGTTTLYSHSYMDIQTSGSAGGGQYRPMSPQGTEDFTVIPFTASKSYLGGTAKGYATIKYANPDQIIRKPLIVAEGFDPGIILAPEEKFGYTSLVGFLEDINKSLSNNLESLLNGTPSQYDIIYVDWRNGTDYLQRNAYLLETIIQWVNNNKQPLGGAMQPNVVLGQSMGGVIARYALKDMENNSINHQTGLYISDDAPHLGANVPQGYQHMVRQARNLYVKTGVTATFITIVQIIRGRANPLRVLSLADQPASRQMLMNFVAGNNTIDNTAHATWQTELKNMGYPNGVSGIPFRKVAISNGSECANPQPFAAGANLLTFYGKGNTRILGDILGMAGLPVAGVVLGQGPLLLGIIPGRNDFNFDFVVNAQADGTSNLVYRGKITYTKKVLWLVSVSSDIANSSYYSNASTLPYDYFPGGYYNTGLDFKNSAYQGTFIKYSITASNRPTFDFVPTVSALDIGQGNVTLAKVDYLARYIGATPPAAPKNSPFDNFITAFNNDRVNEQHISITRRNGDWLAAELNGSPQSASCSGLCDNITISGNPGLCDPGTYSISGFSGTATYTWSASPSGIVNITPVGDGSQATISKSQNGNTTVSATINSSCGSSITVSLPIVVGPPVITKIDYHTSGGCYGAYQTWLLSATANTAVSSWLWKVDNPVNNNWNIYSPYSSQTYVDVKGGGGISVYATNACGTGKNGVTIWSNCTNSSAIIAFPNPAGNSVTISTDQSSVLSKADKEKTMIYNIRVIDQAGILKKQFSYSAGVRSTKIDLGGLIRGVYTVQVFDGTSWNSVQVFKE